MDQFMTVITSLFSPSMMLIIVSCSALGLFMGAIPGLTALMACVLLVPFTFYMSTTEAASAMISASAMAIFAGDIPNATIRMPGTPASAAYTMDSYALGVAGQANRALGGGLLASMGGGLFGVVLLIFFAPLLAKAAFYFSSDEYFWLMILGLSSGITVSRSSVLRGIISLTCGLFFSTVGLSIIGGSPRFTFGSTELMGGVSLIPALIGLFAVPELIRGFQGGIAAMSSQVQITGSVILGRVKEVLKYKWGMLRSSFIGAVIGALPGAGADIAAWVTYGVSKRVTSLPKETPEWRLEGIVNASSANNASLAGAWIPALVLGIPGDTITAVVIGVLYIHGMRPGPSIFVQQSTQIYTIFGTFIIANLLMLPFGWCAIRAMGLFLRIPRLVIMPFILIACIVGAYSANYTVFNIWIMLVFGFLGWVFELLRIPLAPIVLGLILGAPMEQSLVSSLQKYGGDPFGLFHRPVSLLLIAITCLLWATEFVRIKLADRKARRME